LETEINNSGPGLARNPCFLLQSWPIKIFEAAWKQQFTKVSHELIPSL